MAARRFLALLSLFIMLSCACGYYHTTSRGRSMSGTVALPFLDNRSTQPDLEVLATEAIIAALEADGLLRVVSRGNEDYLLSGWVSQYSETPFSIADSGTADEYRLSLALTMSFVNTLSGEELFKDKVFASSHNFYIEGSVAGQDLTRDYAEEKTLEKIVDDILNHIFGNW